MMTRNQQFMLTITAVLVILLCGVWFVEHGLEFLELKIQPMLAALIDLGKAIAGAAEVENRLTAMLVYVTGNFLISCIVLLS